MVQLFPYARMNFIWDSTIRLWLNKLAENSTHTFTYGKIGPRYNLIIMCSWDRPPTQKGLKFHAIGLRGFGPASRCKPNLSVRCWSSAQNPNEWESTRFLSQCIPPISHQLTRFVHMAREWFGNVSNFIVDQCMLGSISLR